MDDALGVDKTSTWDTGRPNSTLASMTSRALFIMVAESMVILAPMAQLGCLRAWAGVAAASFSGARCETGPPRP
jgi:hypothetical protein